MKRLLVNKTNLFDTKVETADAPEIKENQILLKIEKYAFTTNNITYAVSAPKLKYWDFFPVAEPWGVIPVWGYAKVEASNVEGIEVGERCYGYFPTCDYLVAEPGKINPMGFVDLAAHRQALAPVYNHYRRLANDPMFDPRVEDYMPIIQPLFITSFLNYHFLKESNFFEADNMVLTSASSKTGLALGYMLKKYQAEDNKKIIGLTSARNVAFVKSTGYYDEVLSYDEVADKLENKSTVVIDFAGNADLLNQIHEQLGAALKHISLIGLTDWNSGKDFKSIPVARFFFAPTHAQQKFKQWGVKEANMKIATELAGFNKDAAKWMELTYVKEWDQLNTLYKEMLNGKVDPSKGYVIAV